MKILKPLFLLSLVLIISCNTKKEKPEETISAEISMFKADAILESNILKIKETANTLADSTVFPRHIPKTQKNWEVKGYKDWCSGFWPGVLWYAYEFSGDSLLRQQAERFTAPIKPIAYAPAENHDIGFMVYCSYGNGYRITGNEKFKEVLLSAADTLATLYNPKVGSILSWPSQTQYRHNTIIDNMMNLELLFWAAKNGGDKKLYDIAESHATVTMKNLMREDGSLFHLGSFNEETGELIAGRTHQGYADDSMWARGQTWGIYGFSIAYRETGNEEFLKSAIILADHFLERLPEDGIPYWDFDDPKIPDSPKDASAAAIAACGLFELATVTKDPLLQEKYNDAAKIFLEKLSTDEYLSGDTNQALLLHSTGHHPHNSEIDEPIIYADYYYMEALLRLKKLNEKNSAKLTSTE